MTRITDRRVFLAILAALHFVAAPCVAMTAAAGDEACEHCGAGRDAAPCASTATDPGNDEGAPGPGRYRLPESSGSMALPSLPFMPVADGLSVASPAERIGRETGRHTGDPPLNVLYGKFLN